MKPTRFKPARECAYEIELYFVHMKLKSHYSFKKLIINNYVKLT